MSDIGRYRPIYPRLWRHPQFVQLTKSARELTLYLLSGPQTNRIGCFFLSVATAAEDLNVSVETVRKGLADVSAGFRWMFDAKSRVFYIPSWWKWNPPANANVLKGNLKDLNEIPPCSLADAFARNLVTLPETFHETFVEGCRQRMREPSPNQYQDQQHFQDQKHTPARSARASERKGQSNGSGMVDTPVLELARLALSIHNPAAPIDELLDVMTGINRNKGEAVHFVRADAIAALNIAISERGTHR